MALALATTRQKQAARRNLIKTRQAQRAGAQGRKTPTPTNQHDSLPANQFAFPDERQEPLTDAKHVRNAIARFEQVKDVSDAARDRAWKRILTAAERHDVEVSATTWRELFRGGKTKKISPHRHRTSGG